MERMPTATYALAARSGGDTLTASYRTRLEALAAARRLVAEALPQGGRVAYEPPSVCPGLEGFVVTAADASPVASIAVVGPPLALAAA